MFYFVKMYTILNANVIIKKNEVINSQISGKTKNRELLLIKIVHLMIFTCLIKTMFCFFKEPIKMSLFSAKFQKIGKLYTLFSTILILANSSLIGLLPLIVGF